MSHLTQHRYKQRTQLLTSIEWTLKHDAIQYCKDNLVTLSQLIHDLLTERLERANSRIYDWSVLEVIPKHFPVVFINNVLPSIRKWI